MCVKSQDKCPGGAEPTTFTSFSLATMQQSMSIGEDMPLPSNSPPGTPPKSPPAMPASPLSQDEDSGAAALSPPQPSSSPIGPQSAKTALMPRYSKIDFLKKNCSVTSTAGHKPGNHD